MCTGKYSDESCPYEFVVPGHKIGFSDRSLSNQVTGHFVTRPQGQTINSGSGFIIVFYGTTRCASGFDKTSPFLPVENLNTATGQAINLVICII